MAKKEVKTSNKDVKNKKSFFKGFKAELKKVIWPTPKQLVNNTIAVITIVLITAIIVFVLDFTFEMINKNGIEKIKAFVDSTNSQQENTNNTSETENTSNTENATDTNNVAGEENTTVDNNQENETTSENTENNVQ